jgi:hypothetical protein
MSKIVVVAGNKQQFRDWVNKNIISITDKYDLVKLRGINIDSYYEVGTFYEWYDYKIGDEIASRMVNKKEK